MQFFYERYKRVIKLRLTKKFIKTIKLIPKNRTRNAQTYIKSFLNNYTAFMQYSRLSSSTSNFLLGIKYQNIFLSLDNFLHLISNYFKKKKFFKKMFLKKLVLKKKSYSTVLPVKVSLYKLFNFVLRNRQFLQKLFQLKKTHQFSRIHFKSFKKSKNRLGIYNYIFKMEHRILPQFFFSFLFPKVRFLKQLLLNGQLEINNQLIAGYNRLITDMDIISLPKNVQLSGINFVEHVFLKKIRLKLIRVKSFRQAFLSVFLKSSFKSKLFHNINSYFKAFVLTNSFYTYSLYFLFFLDLSFETIGFNSLEIPYKFYRYKTVSKVVDTWIKNFVCFTRFITLVNVYDFSRKIFKNLENSFFYYQFLIFFPNFFLVNYLLFAWLKYLTYYKPFNIFFLKTVVKAYFKQVPNKLLQFRNFFFSKTINFFFICFYNIFYCFNSILFILYSYFFCYFSSFLKNNVFDKKIHLFLHEILNIRTKVTLPLKFLNNSYLARSRFKCNQLKFESSMVLFRFMRYYIKYMQLVKQNKIKRFKVPFSLLCGTLKFFYFLVCLKFVKNKIFLRKLTILFYKLLYLYTKFKRTLKEWSLKKNYFFSSKVKLKKLFIKFKSELIYNFFYNNNKLLKGKKFFNKMNFFKTLYTKFFIHKQSLKFITYSKVHPFKVFCLNLEVKYDIKNLGFFINQKKKIFKKNFFFILERLKTFFFLKTNLNLYTGYEYLILKLFVLRLNSFINFFIFSFSTIKFFINYNLIILCKNNFIELNNVYIYFLFTQYKSRYKFNAFKFNLNTSFFQNFNVSHEFLVHSRNCWFKKFCILNNDTDFTPETSMKHPFPYLNTKFQKFFFANPNEKRSDSYNQLNIFYSSMSDNIDNSISNE